MNMKSIAAIVLCLLCMTSRLTSSLPSDVDGEENDVNTINEDQLLSVRVGQRLQQEEEQSKQHQLIGVQLRNSRPQGCPADFAYLPSVRGCYKVVTDLLPWATAGLRCRALDNNAHLLIITSAAEHRAVVEELVKWYGGCEWGMWTAGQRVSPGTPHSEFVWKIVNGVECPRMFEITYKHWGTEEPSSNSNGAESCMHLFRQKGYMWNDWQCHIQLCSVCEIDM